jgi:hypothetical protein
MSRKMVAFVVAHPALISVFFLMLAACRPDLPCG